MLGRGGSDSRGKRILWAVIAGVIGAVVGVVVCEIADALLLAITVEAFIAIVRNMLESSLIFH